MLAVRLLVSAAVALLGEANWWRPRWVRRLVERAEPAVDSV
jgi:hypothetical protein